MSGWLLLGLPGAVFVAGLGEGWIVLGLACGAWGSWRLVAPRLRAFIDIATETFPQRMLSTMADPNSPPGGSPDTARPSDPS